MEPVLIVSSDEKKGEMLRQILDPGRCEGIISAKTAGQSRELYHRYDLGLVIINSPLTDCQAEELAEELLENTGAGVILLTSPECEEQAEKRLLPLGGYVMAKPISKKIFLKAVRLMVAMRMRVQRINGENLRLQKKIDDIRIINRAKYVLMEYLSMTEQQAHRYLEKQAMDLRLTKLEVAKNLLSTYDG